MSEQSNGTGMATASLATGVLAWLSHCCCCCACVGPLLAILAIIFGASARGSMKAADNYNGFGMATAGIVLGLVYFLLIAAWFILWASVSLAWPLVLAPFAWL
jgi:hypothetical protein